MRLRKISSLWATMVAFIFAVTSLTVTAQDRAADDQAGAMAFIEELATQTTAVWSNPELTKGARDTAFYSLFEQAADINYIAKVMMGRQYRQIPRDKFSEYVTAVKDYIIREFDKRMTQIGFEKLEVTGITALPGRRGVVMVNSAVKRKDGPDMIVKWRVDKRNKKFKVINMTVEGINMALVNRDYFQDRLKKVGIDGLISELKNKQAVAEQP